MGNGKNLKICPNCFASNPEQSDFCNKCGTAIEKKPDTLSYDTFAIPSDIKIQFSPGDSFGKRYRIIEEIGRGGMGIVYKAEDLELNITVALKIIHPKFSGDPRFIERFKKEILSARSVSHQNVIRIFDLGEEDDIKYISMEFIRGQDLRDLISTSGSLTTKRALELIRQICEALKAAHSTDIIHRDLKPSNIMIDKDGHAHVMDFGLAESISSLEPEMSEEPLGTPKYMSPEQAKREELDHRTDIYSLGLIMFEMLTGKSVFEAETRDEYLAKQIKEKPPFPSEKNPDIPLQLDKIVAKCLEKDKDNRYQNIEEILGNLANCEAQFLQPTQPSKLKKFLPYILVTAALLIIVSGIFIFRKGQKDAIPPLSEKMRIPIAVVYFENNTGDNSLDYLRRAFTNLIIYDLLQSKYIRPLTADRLVEIHGQLNLDDSGHYSTEDLKKLAVRGDAENILWGSIHKSDDKSRIRVNTSIYEASSMEPIGHFSAEGLNETEIVDDLTRKVKTSFNLSDALIAEDIDRDIGEITTESSIALNNYFQGLKYYDERKFELSNEYLFKAIDLDPGFAMAYRKIAGNFYYLGDAINGDKYLEKAMSGLDRVSDRERYLIQGFYAQGIGNSLAEAIKHYQELLTIYPDDIDGNIQLGSVYRNLEEWDEALIRFERVLQVDRSNILANLNKVYIFKAKGFYERAKVFLESNRHVFTNQAVFHRLRSQLFLNQGKTELALEDIEALLSIEPENLDYNLIKGQIHQVNDEFLSASKEYKILMNQDDEDRHLRGQLWMSRIYLAKGMLENAKKEALEGLTFARENRLQAYELDFLLTLAYLYLRTKAFDDALNIADQVIEIASDIKAKTEERYGHIYRGLALIGMENIPMAEEAASQLKNLIEVSGFKNFMRNYYYLMGMIYLKKSNVPQALDYFEMASDSLPHQKSTSDNHAFYLDALAAAERTKGDIYKAQNYFEQITELNTGKLKWGDIYALSYYHLGKIYQGRDLKKEAIVQFHKFLELWEDADYAQIEREDAKKQLAFLGNQNYHGNY